MRGHVTCVISAIRPCQASIFIVTLMLGLKIEVLTSLFVMPLPLPYLS